MTTPTTETDDQTDEGATEQGKGNEAAKYRTRLRSTEAERDTLAARVARLQTSEVHRLAGARMADPDDLTVHGVQVVDLLDDDGEVDEAKVEAAVDDLLARKPRLAVDYEPLVDDLDGGARATVRRSSASWSGVLTSASRREPQR
jgi:hypothetical protein